MNGCTVIKVLEVKDEKRKNSKRTETHWQGSLCLFCNLSCAIAFHREDGSQKTVG